MDISHARRIYSEWVNDGYVTQEELIKAAGRLSWSNPVDVGRGADIAWVLSL